MEDKYKIAVEALNWEARYRQNRAIIDGKRYFLPEINELDEDFEEAFLKLKIRNGKMLDIGCGTGMQTIHLGKMGFEVVAIDVSETAIQKGKTEAKKEKVKIHFKQDNILNPTLKDEFDVIIDRGCFTLLAGKFKVLYAKNLLPLLKSKGFFLLKTDFKIGEKAVTNNFLPAFCLVEAKESVYPSGEKKKIKAMFYIFKKEINFLQKIIS